MNRFANYGRLDEVPEVVGDAAFNRLDMLTDPALLPPQSLARNENMRFDVDGTSVRLGMSRQFAPGTSIGNILLAGIYKPDISDDQHALVTSNSLVLFRSDLQTVTTYAFPAGETIGIGDKIDIVQAGVGAGSIPQLYILRGLGQTVLKFDGTSVTVDNDFEHGEFAIFYQDRIAVNSTTQAVAVSDFLDFTTWTVLNQFQILKGGDDYLVCFLSYQKDYVLIGSRKAWSIAFFDPANGVSGYEGGLKTNTSWLRQLTREAGPLGPRAALEALGKIWFITDGAIYAFTPQLDNQLTVLGKPISADIQPIMQRMSSRYARGSWIERYGYRLYFGLVISDEPGSVTSLSAVTVLTLGLTLPFTLPASLSSSTAATFTTATAHNLRAGDTVQLAGSTSSDYNGEFDVASVLDAFRFTVLLNPSDATAIGERMTFQKLATRVNCIAVFNLNNNGWESIDWLPANFYADWARVADYGARRRLWVYDAIRGPVLYEQGEVDETGDVLGGLRLPFTLPARLSAGNYATTPIAGAWDSRTFRFGPFARKVREVEVRATLDTDSAVTMSLLATTPNSRVWTGTREFVRTDFTENDAPLRKRCGERALEAQVQIRTSGGRPTFRSVMIETAAVGRVEE